MTTELATDAIDPLRGVALAEANLVALVDAYSVLPGARRIEEDGLQGLVCDVPLSFFNLVAATRLDEARAEAVVSRTLRAYAERGARCRWWHTPLTRPASLDATLVAQGMRVHYEAPSMVADLDQLPPAREPSPGFTIEAVRDEATLERWARTLMTVFQRSDEDARGFARGYAALGLDESAAWQHVYGFVDGEPVGTASVFIGGGTCGIYHVGTLPAGRGRGVGTALTRDLLVTARARGVRTSVLQSSGLGYGVYRSLGYVDCGPVRAYEKSP